MPEQEGGYKPYAQGFIKAESPISNSDFYNTNHEKGALLEQSPSIKRETPDFPGYLTQPDSHPLSTVISADGQDYDYLRNPKIDPLHREDTSELGTPSSLGTDTTKDTRRKKLSIEEEKEKKRKIAWLNNNKRKKNRLEAKEKLGDLKRNEVKTLETLKIRVPEVENELKLKYNYRGGERPTPTDPREINSKRRNVLFAQNSRDYDTIRQLEKLLELNKDVRDSQIQRLKEKIAKRQEELESIPHLQRIKPSGLKRKGSDEKSLLHPQTSRGEETSVTLETKAELTDNDDTLWPMDWQHEQEDTYALTPQGDGDRDIKPEEQSMPWDSQHETYPSYTPHSQAQGLWNQGEIDPSLTLQFQDSLVNPQVAPPQGEGTLMVRRQTTTITTTESIVFQPQTFYTIGNQGVPEIVQHQQDIEWPPYQYPPTGYWSPPPAYEE